MSKIAGEYDCVAAQSINPARLRLAHQTPCTPDMAYFLIAMMHDKLFGTTVAAPKVRLRQPRAGKHTARGWGGTIVDPKTGKLRGYVSLPETPYDPARHRSPLGLLRVGLVLHEYAHAVEMLRHGRTNHEARFTMILDALLYDSEPLWNAQPVAIAAEVK